MNTPSIFITGAASGIGKATAQRFAQEGWFVGLFDINETALAELAKELTEDTGCDCCYQVTDVTNENSLVNAINLFAKATDSRMDILFNSAGILDVGLYEDCSPQTTKAIFDINVLGLMTCTQFAMPLLEDTPNSRVINMSSASAQSGVPDFAAYSASKFAVRGFTEALNIEWRQHDIHVCDIMPSFVQGPMVSNAKHSQSMDKLGVKITAIQVAETVWRASQKKKLHWRLGWDFRLLCFLQRLGPDATNAFMMRKIAGF